MIAAVIEGVTPLLGNARARSGWRAHKSEEDQLVALARADATVRRNRAQPINGPVVVTLVVSPPDRDVRGRRRSRFPDVDGYAPTLKRMLDGVVRAGVITDDGPHIVAEVRTRQSTPGPLWRLELHIHRLTETRKQR